MSSPPRSVFVAAHALAGLVGGLTGLAGVFLFFGAWPSAHRAVLYGAAGSSFWGVLCGLFIAMPALQAAKPGLPRLRPVPVALAFAMPAFFPCGLWLLIRSGRTLLS